MAADKEAIDLSRVTLTILRVIRSHKIIVYSVPEYINTHRLVPSHPERWHLLESRQTHHCRPPELLYQTPCKDRTSLVIGVKV